MSRAETTRERILAAAGRVMQDKGLAHATTKQIAAAAGCSEATLYKYFTGKEDLFGKVLRRRLAPFIGLVARLPEEAGDGAIRDRLERVCRTMLDAFAHAGRPAMALFAEPDLLAAQRAAFHRTGGGPQNANRLVADYLRAEQRLGRIGDRADPVTAADLLLGACFQRSFFIDFVGLEAVNRSTDEFVRATVDAVLRILEPGAG